MELIKQLDLGYYKFRIQVCSETVHAHSLMSDHKQTLEEMIEELNSKLMIMVKIHKEVKP